MGACLRESSLELARFLDIAFGSACELESQVMLAHRLGMLADENASDVGRRIRLVKTQLYRLRQRVLAGRSEPRRKCAGTDN